MIDWYDVKYILKCTAENLYCILPILLLSGAAAFLVASAVRGRIKSTVIRLLPMVFAEFALLAVMLPYLIRWVGIQSFTWGFWYEGGLDFYLPFSAMLGILAGYLLEMAFWKRKV